MTGVATFPTSAPATLPTRPRAWSRSRVSITPTLPSMSSIFCGEIACQADERNSFYLGKKIAYVYTAQKEVRGSKIRVIWGKVTRPHGIYIPLETRSKCSANDVILMVTI